MNMHRAIRTAYDSLPDKGEIEEGDLCFPGFDGNEETKRFAYMRFLTEEQGKWTELKKGTWNNFNSHMPMLDTYREMMERWEGSKEKHKLTADDIRRIVAKS